MQTSILIILTVLALFAAMLASVFILKNKIVKTKNKPTLNDFNCLSAESLLEVVTGLPLSEILSAGDKVEIVIKTNGHPIADAQYAVCKWDDLIKLTSQGDES